MEDLIDAIIKFAGCCAGVEYAWKILKRFWKWLQPENKESSEKK